MLYWSSRVIKVLILNIAYFLTVFVKKASTYFDRAKKEVKSLKIENFDQTSENLHFTRPVAIRYSEV